MQRRLILVAWLVAAASLGAGCSSGGPSGATRPTASLAAAATAEAAAPSKAELDAIKFRTENSLLATLEHVRAVADDPTAGMEFGVPLLPTEFEELMSRSASVESILPIIRAEAAKAPNDYCGVYIDNANEGALTSGWKANRILHELAIRAQVQPRAKVAFIDCRFSDPEVNRVCDLLRETDHDWMKAIPAQIQGFGCGNKNFRVEMDVSSAVPDAPEQVVRHYTELFDLPPGILVVTSDGTGAELVPWGEVRVTAVDAHGDRLTDEVGLLMLVGLDGSGPGQCGSGDMGHGVGVDGIGKLPCQTGTWTIAVVSTWDQASGWTIHGSKRVTVREGETTNVTITVTDPPTE